MQPQARQSSFVNPDKRAAYKEGPTIKNIRHMQTNNIIAHTAPDPTPPAGGQAKMIAKGLRSSWGQPNTVDRDMFTSPQKKGNMG